MTYLDEERRADLHQRSFAVWKQDKALIYGGPAWRIGELTAKGRDLTAEQLAELDRLVTSGCLDVVHHISDGDGGVAGEAMG